MRSRWNGSPARKYRRESRVGIDIQLWDGGYRALCSCGWTSRTHQTYHSACCAKGSHRCPSPIVPGFHVDETPPLMESDHIPHAASQTVTTCPGCQAMMASAGSTR